MSGIKRFMGETVVYGFGSVFSRLFAFFLIPIYIDQLGTEQYANITLIQFIFTLLTFLFALNSGVFFYYYEYKRESIKKSVITSWITYELIIFCAIYLSSIFLYPQISIVFDGSSDPLEIEMAFNYMILGLLPFIINNTFYNHCRIERKPVKAVLTIVSEGFLSLLLILYFIRIENQGVKGVFLGLFSARLIVAFMVMCLGFWRLFIPKYVSFKLIIRMISYSWPFFLISSFFWLMNSIDKFMGTQLLDSHAEVAHLVLAGQITLPIAVFVDVVRQAYGPYVMSIRKNKDAKQTYTAIFSLVIFTGVLISVALVTVSPFLITLLADETFYPALEIIPYFAIAATINVLIGQFGLGLNLTKNNVYIAVGFILGGGVGLVLNYYLQNILGIVGAGVAQIISYTTSAVIIYYFSRKKMRIDYEWGWSITIFSILVVSALIFNNHSLLIGEVSQLFYLLTGGAFIALLLFLGNWKYQITRIFGKNE